MGAGTGASELHGGLDVSPAPSPTIQAPGSPAPRPWERVFLLFCRSPWRRGVCCIQGCCIGRRGREQRGGGRRSGPSAAPALSLIWGTPLGSPRPVSP